MGESHREGKFPPNAGKLCNIFENYCENSTPDDLYNPKCSRKSASFSEQSTKANIFQLFNLPYTAKKLSGNFRDQ
jgi:hypothetical protein